jgi:IS30 family transposase
MTDCTEYQQLSITERAAIELRQRDGFSVRAIARELARAPSTVSRELRRNSGTRGYLAEWAHARAGSRPHHRGLLLDHDPGLAGVVVVVLAEKRSPAQAKMILSARGLAPPSVENIYQWIYRSDVAQELRVASLMRRPRKQRRPRTRIVSGRGRIKDQVNISARPFDPTDRSTFGHWEGDSVVGTKGATALLTLVERKTRYTKLIPISPTTAITAEMALRGLIEELGADLFKSITWDQGKELSNHVSLTRATKVPVYFCDAHSPWQRGLNENTNGVLRWHYPKGKALNLEPSFARRVERWLNSRMMLVLSGRTPEELFRAESVALRC